MGIIDFNIWCVFFGDEFFDIFFVDVLERIGYGGFEYDLSRMDKVFLFGE